MEFENEDKDEQNNYLLFTYLQKVGFSEDTATNMILKRSSNLFGYRGLAYELGEFLWSFLYVFSSRHIFAERK